MQAIGTGGSIGFVSSSFPIPFNITLDVINVARYYSALIASFKDADTEALCGGRRVPRFVEIETVARRKLRQLEIAAS